MTIRRYNVALVGATGLVGKELFNHLLKKDFPIKKLRLFASKKSIGKKLTYRKRDYYVEELRKDSFRGIDLAFFTAGAKVSREFVAEALKAGAIVIDNTSAYRMNYETPLVVPEVNGAVLKENRGIISNPNCSTIQLVLALSPLKKNFGLKRVVVSTYQSISGAGNRAIDRFKEEVLSIVDNEFSLDGFEDQNHPLAFNLIPQIDQFGNNDYTKEEIKMMEETKKILADPELKIAATCVRVPVFVSHSESVYVEIGQDDVSKEEFTKVLKSQQSIKLLDEPSKGIYPTPEIAKGKEEVYIGRVRKDKDINNGFHLWIVSDNLLKGAALNSIHIAQELIAKGLI